MSSTVPLQCRRLYMNFSNSFNPAHWPRRRHRSTAVHGDNGVNGASCLTSRDGYPKAHENIPTNSLYSLFTAGTMDGDTQDQGILLAPYSRKFAISLVASSTDARFQRRILTRTPTCNHWHAEEGQTS
ncbi:uncharacterized protein PITG_15759 [Phytophthora infestans T30-4]|uniref:Uncharacterized protein n=1 Tax=Phytophthora infestans (strain T30-4) TaxID=403677 RepID=D0NSH3_PHYIT|nr:uncharacterized protein PITG_15759 [Phytophthora infestans T30-4]EEY64518.1 conserved hypothetical protein [Phytophthora infestans T30-4]|eukprot:XP_002898021.1 conserved hypothetical protein [Phytophthora infestans T30-4]